MLTIQSDDLKIKNQAQAIIDQAPGGKSSIYQVVNALAQWIECNINFANPDPDTQPRDALGVLNSAAKSTQCEGGADLLVAFCRSSEPNQNVRQIYDALKFKYAPFIRKKSVVHKSEFEDSQIIDKQYFLSP